MTRIFNVVRMQWINRATFFTVPLIILGAAFLITLLTFALIPVEGPKFGGGIQAPMWYFMVIGIQSLTLTFPFSQAMSITRREFLVGSTLAAAATALPLSVVFVIAGMIESATNGWGLNGWMFHLPWMWADGILSAWLLYFALPMLFFVGGFFVATIYKRFGMTTLTVLLVGLAALLVLAVAVITRTEEWGRVLQWFAGITVTGLGGYLLLCSALLTGCSWLVIRRAVS